MSLLAYGPVLLKVGFLVISGEIFLGKLATPIYDLGSRLIILIKEIRIHHLFR